MARNDKLVLSQIVEEIERYEEANDLLTDISTELRCNEQLTMPTRIRLDRYTGYDDSE